MSDSDRRRRADARRARAVLHRTSLDCSDADGDAPVTGAVAVSLAARLSRWSWSLAGRKRPAYGRSETPCRFVPHDRS